MMAVKSYAISALIMLILTFTVFTGMDYLTGLPFLNWVTVPGLPWFGAAVVLLGALVLLPPVYNVLTR